MKFFSTQQRFDPITGVPIMLQTSTGWVCDYCGSLYDDQKYYNDGNVTPIKYQILETDEVEPQFSELRLKGFPELSAYDLYNMHPEMVYCQDVNSNQPHCEYAMMKEWMKKKGKFQDCNQICQVMYQARMDMLDKWIGNGTYNLKQFNLG